MKQVWWNYFIDELIAEFSFGRQVGRHVPNQLTFLGTLPPDIDACQPVN